jgi:hypothetical protein
LIEVDLPLEVINMASAREKSITCIAATKPNEESMLHELLDLDYLISALLVGGLACRETRFVERFRFLRPDGVILR